MKHEDIAHDHLPDAPTFIVWVKRALADLDKKPSHFLREDGMPGSLNRVGNLLKNPTALKLDVARRLEKEIREEARRQGKTLLPIIVDLGGV